MKALTAVRMLWKGLVKGDEPSRFGLAERAARFFYPHYKFSEYGRLFLDDEEFRRLYESFEGTRNYHSLDRKFVLSQLAQLAREVPGDTAECGVFHGGSSHLICARIEDAGKEHHLFDSFEGLSEPGEADGEYWKKGDLSFGEDAVLERLARFPFVRSHKGWIPERFTDVEDRRFALVHVDVDLYEPTRDAVVFFWERLSPGGVLVCDDYGFRSCPGATRALDEHFQPKGVPVVHLPTGQGLVFKLPAVP